VTPVSGSDAFRVEQLVISDPGGDEARGYVLLARSPGVADPDAEFISASPGISDYLHVEESPGPFFSFHSLPGGSWTLIKRFVRGTRRGGFNRIVVHALIFGPDILEPLGADAWLLVSACGFRPAGEASKLLTHAQLTLLVSVPELTELAALDCVLPADPLASTLTAMEDRRLYLERTWDPVTLDNGLASLLSALESGRSILLPQAPEFEQLLALVWTTLPPADRPSCPWTTHFAPGTRVLHRLANSPEPETTRRLHPNSAEWLVFPESVAETPCARALSKLLPENGTDTTRAVFAGLDRYDLSLLEEPATVARWIAWNSILSSQTREGCQDPRELSLWFAAIRAPGGGIDPWVGDSEIVSCACGTFRRMRRSGTSADVAVRSVVDALLGAACPGAFSQPGPLSSLPADPGLLEAALALSVALHPTPPQGLHEREVTARTLACRDRIRMVVSGPESPAIGVLSELALGLACCRSALAGPLLEEVSALPSGSDRLVSGLVGPVANARAGLVLLDVLARANLPAACRLMGERLVPLLASITEPDDAEDREIIRRGLALLRDSGPLQEALRTWKGGRLLMATDELRRLLPTSPLRARQVAEDLARHAATEQLADGAFYGLWLELRRCGAPSAVWVTFAHGEALGRDDSRDPTGSMQLLRSLEEHAPDPGDLLHGARRLLELLGDSSIGSLPGPCRRALLRLFAPAATDLPREFRRFLSATLAAAPDATQWEPILEEVHGALARAGRREEAGSLAGEWWLGVARSPWTRAPVRLVDTLETLSGPPRRAVLREWAKSLWKLQSDPDSDRLARSFFRLASKSPEDGLDLSCALLSRDIASGRCDLERAVCAADRLSARCQSPQARLGQALRRLLPADQSQRGREVLRLLQATDVRPTVKAGLERTFLKGAIQILLHDSSFNPVVVLRQRTIRGTVVMTLAAEIGRCWRQFPSRVGDFLSECIAAGRRDAALELLQAVSPRREVGQFVSWLSRDRPEVLEGLRRRGTATARWLARSCDTGPSLRYVSRAGRFSS